MGFLFWSGISALQTLFLPGYLALRLLRFERLSGLHTALFSFGLSVTLNHFLVVGLVLAGRFTRPVLLAVLLAELLVWAAITLRSKPGAPATPVARPRELPFGLLLAAACAVAVFAAEVPRSAGLVFEYWDVIASWNRWALDWQTGHLPEVTYHYPQLIPTSWSLLYVFLGHPVQFLARGMMALFPLGILLIFLDLGLRHRKTEYLLACVFSAVALVLLYGSFLGSGMADLPVAFMALLTLFPFFTEDFSRNARGRLGAAVLCAIGCGLTKQAGLYAAALLPLFAWWALAPAWPRARRAKVLAALFVILVAGILPWYLYADSQLATSELSVQGIRERTAWERLMRGTKLLRKSMTAPILAGSALLVLFSLRKSKMRRITLGISLPFTGIWVALFCYDKRNLALAVPFLAWSAAAGAETLHETIRTRLPQVLRRPRLAAGIVIGICALWAGATVSSEAILKAHHRQLMKAGEKELQERMIDHQRKRGFEGMILTDYRRLLAFEELRPHYFIDRDAPPEEFWPLREGLELFARVVEDPRNDIRYVLKKYLRGEGAIDAYIDDRIRSGSWEELFRADDYRLVHVLEPEVGP